MKKYTKLLVFILFIMILIVFKTSVFASDYFSATDEELEKAFDIYLYSNQTNGLEFEGKYLFGVENNVPYYNHPLDHTIYITKIKRASLSSDGYMVGWCYDCENEFNYLRKKILKNKYNDVKNSMSCHRFTLTLCHNLIHFLVTDSGAIAPDF